jgi:hypothetical protein
MRADVLAEFEACQGFIPFVLPFGMRIRLLGSEASNAERAEFRRKRHESTRCSCGQPLEKPKAKRCDPCGKARIRAQKRAWWTRAK